MDPPSQNMQTCRNKEVWKQSLIAFSCSLNLFPDFVKKKNNKKRRSLFVVLLEKNPSEFFALGKNLPEDGSFDTSSVIGKLQEKMYKECKWIFYVLSVNCLKQCDWHALKGGKAELQLLCFR